MNEIIDLKAKDILLATRLHDIAFRKNHVCNCKRKVDYGNGRTYCVAMQKSRMKSAIIRKLQDEYIQLAIEPYGEEVKDLISASNINKTGDENGN